MVLKITVEKQTIIKISGSDKQLVGMTASKIKSFRPIEPYKGKGIKEKGQYILKKKVKKNNETNSTIIRKKFRVRNKLKKLLQQIDID